MTKYAILFINRETTEERQCVITVGNGLDGMYEAGRWAMDNAAANEYYFIDEVEELPAQNMQETVKEFFDYLDECSNGAGIKMMF